VVRSPVRILALAILAALGHQGAQAALAQDIELDDVSSVRRAIESGAATPDAASVRASGSPRRAHGASRMALRCSIHAGTTRKEQP
jgi:hypothetical protein